MWQYAVGAGVLFVGYLLNEDSKRKLRVGDTAFVPFSSISLLFGGNLPSLPFGANPDVPCLVTNIDDKSKLGLVKGIVVGGASGFTAGTNVQFATHSPVRVTRAGLNINHNGR